MLRITLRSLLARRFRVVTTGLAVIAGVALLAGTLTLTDTVGQTFDDLFADVNAGTDAFVRATDVVDTRFDTVRRRIPADLVAKVRGVDGVRAAFGGVQGYAQIVGRDGDPVGNPDQGPPTLGTTWVADRALNPFRIFEGRPPAAAAEVVIDRATAKAGDLHVGDRTTLLTQKPPAQVTIVGIALFGAADGPGGASFALLDDGYAQQLLAQPGRYDGIAVAGEPGVSEEQLASRIRAVMPEGIEVVTGAQITAEDQSALDDALGFFNAFMVTFAGVALFVGAFIIYNTFSIVVAQRTRELALLRAVGASRGQVLGGVLLESAAVGAIASLLGLVAGIGVAVGLKGLLAGLGFGLPAAGLVLRPQSLITAFAVGLAITVLSSILPARRASHVAPVAALRDVAIDTSGFSRRRLIGGVIVTGLGLASLIGGLAGSGQRGLSMVGLGTSVTFLGVAVLGPIIASPVTRVLGAPIRRLRGIPGRLARENALRNPKRTATTASALMIGVALIGFITIFAASAKRSIVSIIDRTFIGDFVIDSGTQGFGGLSPALAERLNDIPEVGAASGLRLAPVERDGSGTFVVGVDPATLSQLLDFGITAGRVDDLTEGTIALEASSAEADGLHIGDTVTMRFADSGKQALRVAALYENNDLVGNAFVSLATLEANVADQFDTQIYVSIADGVSPEAARAAIERVAADFANAKVNDRTEFKQSIASQVNQILGLIYVMLGLAVVIALIGIANTLVLSVLERTHELGLLRAVGMTRDQLRESVRWESVLIACFGALLGLAIGLVFGWALVQALADEGIDQLAIPLRQLLTIAAVAGLVGVIAAVIPARRAARLDVLAAISTE